MCNSVITALSFHKPLGMPTLSFGESRAGWLLFTLSECESRTRSRKPCPECQINLGEGRMQKHCAENCKNKEALKNATLRVINFQTNKD